MNKNKYFTNQELLKELEKRLPDFTEDEMRSLLELVLMNVPNHYKEKLLNLDPQQANDFMKKSMQEVENKKTDKLTKKIKKFLGKNNMPKSKKLENKIASELNKLQGLLNKIAESQNINPDDSET
jgi:hypothetical protein